MTAPGKPLALIVPVYGNHHLTHALLDDVAAESDVVETYVIDNRGDYERRGDELAIRSGSNRGWAGGVNLALDVLRHRPYDAYVLINNDVRLSAGFFAGLERAWVQTSAGLLGPVYDDAWDHQRRAHSGPAAAWRARAVHSVVPFLDGVCLFIPRATLTSVGLLDQTTFPRFNWGADIDYAARVRRGEARSGSPNSPTSPTAATPPRAPRRRAGRTRRGPR